MTSRIENITEVMTSIYIHPCYFIKIIQYELMSDDEVMVMLTQIYENTSTIRTSYMIQYALAALERDLENVKGVKDFDSVNLRMLPSNRVIVEEEKILKLNKKIKQQLKKKFRKNKKKDKENAMEEEDIDSDDENKDQTQNRPESLFYRLIKWTILKDEGTRDFIYLIAIYIINKVYSYPVQPDTDEQHYMAFDIHFESEPSQKIAESNQKQVQVYLQRRKDDLKAFYNDMFDKLIRSELDIDKINMRLFEMKKFIDKDEDTRFKDDPELEREQYYTPRLSDEMKYFMIQSFKMIKNKFKKDPKIFIMQARILDILFEQTKDVIEKFQFHLLPYSSKNKYTRKVGTEIEKNHRYNLINVCNVIQAVVSYTDAVKEDENGSSSFQDFNLEVKNESRNRIENIFSRLTNNGDITYPEITCFQNLVYHSFESDNVKVNLRVEDFLKIISTIMEHKKEIFDRDEPDYDYLYQQLSEIDDVDFKMLKEKSEGNYKRFYCCFNHLDCN